jgi:arylsulfatase
MLLTGYHSGHAQIRSNDEWPERGDVWDFERVSNEPYLEGQRPMAAGTQTIGTLLQKAGYKTGVVGKWGLGGPLTESIPNKLGFDFFVGYNCQRQAHTYFPLHLWKNTEKIPLNNRMVPPGTRIPEGGDPYNIESYNDFWLNEYSSELMQKELIQFIKDHKDEPFFMYYANPVPHVPLQAPKRWVDYYVKKFGDEEPYSGDKGYFPHRYPHAAYAAMVSYFDEQVGEIVNTLKELGLFENTIILFSSDNGPTFNGGTDSPWFDSARPFKSEQGWGKANLREGGIRIPMIAHWPGKIKPGTQTDHLSAHYDVLPTLCELAQVVPPENIDGISFLPTLLGKEQQKKHTFLYWEYPASGGQQAVRMGDWKGIRTHMFQNNLKIELFNLENDFREQVDLSEKFPEVVTEIRQLFEREHTRSEIERFKFAVLND